MSIIDKIRESYRTTAKWKIAIGVICGGFLLIKFVYDAGYPWGCQQARQALSKAESELYTSDNAWYAGRQKYKAQQDRDRLCR